MKKTILSGICSALFIIGLSSCSGGLFKAKAPVQLQEVWASDNTLKTPESVLFDPDRNLIYVTNINKDTRTSKDGDGFISTLSPEGEIQQLYWVTGLNDPHGMALHNNVLYVADIDEVVAISTQSGAVLGRYRADKARMLNGVAVDDSGNVYVTDTEEHRLYVLRNGRLTTWINNTKGKRPNGIFIQGNRMIVAFSGSAQVMLLDPETKRFSEWVDDVKAADGIDATGDGTYLISSWSGEIFYVDAQNRKWSLLNTSSQNMNTADIDYVEQRGLLLVPTYNDNRVVAYRLNPR
ncbi:gluconolaconase [Pontibacter korlensis]|uniref:Gluconolaconase n=1 Tax=Pontibacter korlensis TaxID=400092 RepID=A0A0E3UZ94_9BACT|nr:gluconolaconase [Pontibacter korlensis]AKD05121.1 gluconolaconase [Pontibacter korlensis]